MRMAAVQDEASSAASAEDLEAVLHKVLAQIERIRHSQSTKKQAAEQEQFVLSRNVSYYLGTGASAELQEVAAVDEDEPQDGGTIPWVDVSLDAEQDMDDLDFTPHEGGSTYVVSRTGGLFEEQNVKVGMVLCKANQEWVLETNDARIDRLYEDEERPLVLRFCGVEHLAAVRALPEVAEASQQIMHLKQLQTKLELRLVKAKEVEQKMDAQQLQTLKQRVEWLREICAKYSVDASITFNELERAASASGTTSC